MIVWTLFSSRMVLLCGLTALTAFAVNNAGIVEEHDLPQSLRPGESVQATWALDLHKTEGFARFQVQFPPGIDAELIESDGASFSFENGRAKFIWIEVPQQKTLDLALNITANEDFQGGTITQWFSFIQEGSRKDVEFEPHPISREPSETEDAAATATASAVQAERFFSMKDSGEGVMRVRLSGMRPGQFLKLTEYLPSQATITPLNDDGGADIRDLLDDRLIYVWQSTPAAPFLEIEYSLRSTDATEIRGEIACIENGQPVQIELPPLDEDVVSADSPSKQPARSMEQEENELNGKFDVAFRVQVLATHEWVNPDAVRRFYAYPGEVKSEQHQEWNKYTTGYYSQYREARDKRVALRTSHDFPGPFVAAYKGNDRITVQEALLITHQNWIP